MFAVAILVLLQDGFHLGDDVVRFVAVPRVDVIQIAVLIGVGVGIVGQWLVEEAFVFVQMRNGVHAESVRSAIQLNHQHRYHSLLLSQVYAESKIWTRMAVTQKRRVVFNSS